MQFYKICGGILTNTLFISSIGNRTNDSNFKNFSNSEYLIEQSRELSYNFNITKNKNNYPKFRGNNNKDSYDQIIGGDMRSIFDKFKRIKINEESMGDNRSPSEDSSASASSVLSNPIDVVSDKSKFIPSGDKTDKLHGKYIEKYNSSSGTLGAIRHNDAISPSVSDPIKTIHCNNITYSMKIPEYRGDPNHYDLSTNRFIQDDTTNPHITSFNNRVDTNTFNSHHTESTRDTMNFDGYSTSNKYNVGYYKLSQESLYGKEPRDYSSLPFKIKKLYKNIVNKTFGKGKRANHVEYTPQPVKKRNKSGHHQIIHLSIAIANSDVKTKAKLARKFIEDGYPVMFRIYVNHENVESIIDKCRSIFEVAKEELESIAKYGGAIQINPSFVSQIFNPIKKDKPPITSKNVNEVTVDQIKYNVNDNKGIPSLPMASKPSSTLSSPPPLPITSPIESKPPPLLPETKIQTLPPPSAVPSKPPKLLIQSPTALKPTQSSSKVHNHPPIAPSPSSLPFESKPQIIPMESKPPPMVNQPLLNSSSNMDGRWKVLNKPVASNKLDRWMSLNKEATRIEAGSIISKEKTVDRWKVLNKTKNNT